MVKAYQGAGHVPTEIDWSADLPVLAVRDELIAAIAQHQVVIVAGETGSGKTTQLPKICLAAGRGRHGLIGHTQPRRIAARTVATRMASASTRMSTCPPFPYFNALPTTFWRADVIAEVSASTSGSGTAACTVTGASSNDVSVTAVPVMVKVALVEGL